MGLDLTTFVLEIINFLVLLWLLAHFLYRPVQAAIAQRQEQAEKARKELQAQRASLDAEKKEVDEARARIDDEHEAAGQRLNAEITAERARRLDALSAELEDERAKAQARAAAQQSQDSRRQDAQAAQRAQDFLRHYLQRLAGPELEGAVIALFLSDVAALDQDARDRLKDTLASTSVEVATAFAPSDAQRKQIEEALEGLLGHAVPTRWKIDSALVAGISLRLDGHLLEASLARSLDAFGAGAEAAS
jgi:F-type H+-transporting ATPase subunit b